MRLGLSPTLWDRLVRLPIDKQRAVIAGMTPFDLLLLDGDYERWAHYAQLPPPGESWRVWLMMAGRGFGKTRAGAEWIHRIAMSGGKRIALVAATQDEARAVMVEGVSGLLNIARNHGRKLRWEPSLGRLTWPGGSVAQLYSGDHGDGLRGPEHHVAWCDELAKWRDGEAAWSNLQLGLRLGARPRALVTTTPRPIELLQRIREHRLTVTTHGRTQDNINLPQSFVEAMLDMYGGTRLGRQELDGELIQEVEGSLWPPALLDKCRVEPAFWGAVSEGRHPPASVRGEALDRIVVGVDPPAGVGTQADACGIVVAGRSGERLFVLDDASVQGLSPEGWASRVAAAALRWGTPLVVAESNNGGAMVASVLKAADFGLRVRLVHASRGKVARAEPVALKFEAGKAFLAGRFARLEGELGGMVAGGGYQGPGRSPDRADAMVWAMTALMESRSGVPRVRRL